MPVRHAARWARRSDTVDTGSRTAAATRSNRSGFSSPARYSRTGGSSSPSAYTCSRSGPSVPGRTPPTSMWWAVVPTQPNSFRPVNTGMITFRSGVCIAPR